MAVRPGRETSASARQQVQAYLASLAPEHRKILRKLRDDIRAAAPGAVEAFSYGVPAFRLNDRPLVWYAAWKQHVSMYPIGTSILRTLPSSLRIYETRKGTIRFPLSKPPSPSLVKKLVKARILEQQRQDSLS